MPTIEVEVEDSTDLLHDANLSDDELDDETYEAMLQDALSTQIEAIYNNREDIAEQLEQQRAQLEE